MASKAWYEQETTNSPPGAMAQGCTVVASASDGSSHNIYWYGGFDGISPTADFYDDVWVLSLPSFIWTKVASGTVTHARAGHKCVKPYPDQMLVIGGYSSLSGGRPKCVEKGIIQIFNLSTAQWIDSYNPTVWSDYEVPAVIATKIGGNGKGGATATAPAKGFANPSLVPVFGTKYDAAKLKVHYPYALKETPTNINPLVPSVTTKPEKGSGTPSYLAPVLAVVLGLFFITLIILAVLLWRRRKYAKSNGTGTQSEAGTMDSRFWVANWLRGTPNIDTKAPTVTTDQTDETYPTSPYDYENDRPDMQEVAGTQVHEMMGM